MWSYQKRVNFQNQQLSIFIKYNKTKSNPNEKFAYSNLGYFILGQLIEKVSDQTYEDYIIENIIKPLGISPEVLDFEITDKTQHAEGYQTNTKKCYSTKM